MPREAVTFGLFGPAPTRRRHPSVAAAFLFPIELVQLTAKANRPPTTIPIVCHAFIERAAERSLQHLSLPLDHE